MPDISRRTLAAGAGLLVGAMTWPAGAQQIAAATTPKFRVQPLSFNPEKINGLSAKAITAHHDDHYAAAVNRLNALSEQLAKLDFIEAPASTISDLKREEHSVYNSTVLHELYFESLGEAATQPSGVFAQAVARDFGSLDRWKAEFAAAGKALDGGSGWVILAYAPRDKRLFNHCCADDGMAPAGGVPLLALDMDKHAYVADYGAKVGKYVDSFMPTIRWTTPERLYREAIRV
ncbi:MAG TPA: Fe-Mn family superoxide dismutase [Reyranella sp.]|jgi:Fe-Mn family superoxide dismutase